MRFQLTIANDRTPNGWVEDYDHDDLLTEADVTLWAHNIIQGFNATLRPGGLPRRLVSIKIIGPSVSAQDVQKDIRVDDLVEILNDTIGELRELVSESTLYNIVHAILDQE